MKLTLILTISAFILAKLSSVRVEPSERSANPLPYECSKVSIRSSYSGWSSSETNLTLMRSNSVFIAAGHTVSESVVSNLLAALREPTREEIDPANLGLNQSWLATNRVRLLAAFGADTPQGVFPRASVRQREWLTNALIDLDVLNSVVREMNHTGWTDDSPEIDIAFSQSDEAVVQLHSSAQISFMLPWVITVGTNWQSTYNADISRGVAALLPEGFLNRERILGDLFSVIVDRFAYQQQVQEKIKRLTVEESLGPLAQRWLNEFEMRDYWVPSGSPGQFPWTWMAALHRTNWPANLTMPVQTLITNGTVEMLPWLLNHADERVAPILKSPWLMKVLAGSSKVSITVAPEGSIVDLEFVRDQMARVGLGDFYDQNKAKLKSGLTFTLRERIEFHERASDWVLLPDGELLLLSFSGMGVLDWTPAELGFRGPSMEIHEYSLNRIGVLLRSDGVVKEVATQTAWQPLFLRGAPVSQGTPDP